MSRNSSSSQFTSYDKKMQVTNALLQRSGRLEEEHTQPLLEPILAKKTGSKEVDDDDDMDFFGGHVEEYSEASGQSRQTNRSQRQKQVPMPKPLEKAKS